METELISLDWDSKYFGFPCGRLVFSVDGIETVGEKMLEEIKKYMFITAVCPEGNSVAREWLGKQTMAYLADVNLQMEKRLCEIPASACSAISYINTEKNGLLELAGAAFQHSRFLQDSNISKGKAAGVYQSWVKNALSSPKKQVAIYQDSKGLQGFVVFSQELTSVRIELIAVSPRSRGKGIGTCLLDEVDRYAWENGLHLVRVGTQIENKRAVHFYFAHGFILENVQYIYHWWRDKREV